MCFKEAMRLHPPVSLIGRRSEKQVEILGNTLPKGIDFMLDFEAQHKNPKIFENPENFDPLRFSQNFPQSSIVGQNYSPFSLGLRSCIGQQFAMLESKVIIGKLFRKFRFSLVKPEECYAVLGLITKPKGGLKVRIHKR
jgi:cytochrome P450